METLKKLTEEFRVFDLETEEEVDLLDVLDSLMDDNSEENSPEGDYFKYYDMDTADSGLPTDDFPPPESYEMDQPVGDDYNFNDELPSDDAPEYGEPEDDEALDIEDKSEEAKLANQTQDEMGMDLEPEEISLDGIEGSSQQNDEDFQGSIRTVRGACLVYKRQQEDGTFEELWIYNTGRKFQREDKIKKGIIAGTDIDLTKLQSQDGSQKLKITTVGNVQFLNITGLPN